MSELKPCPFCGSNDVGIQELTITYLGLGDRLKFTAECSNCGCNSGESATSDEAKMIWNKRTVVIDCKNATKTVHGCLGYSRSEYDDYPLKQCRTCKEYESYDDMKEENND